MAKQFSVDILLRGPDGASIWGGPPFNGSEPSVKLNTVSCSSAVFSDDGGTLMLVKSDSAVSLYDTASLKEKREFKLPNLIAASLSPRGTYLLTFQKPLTPQDRNVIVWRVDSGTSVYDLFQKNTTKTNWPTIRFCPDESVACRMATNELQFHDPTDFSKGIVSRLRVPGIADYELSKAPGSHVAVFVPESKGKPASVQIFPCAHEPQAQPLARRSFFRCSTVQLKWNNGSSGLLCVAQSDVDKTNQSYYGESKLNYLTVDGTHEGLIPLKKEGPIHDVQWSYSGAEFAVVYGYMPASATIFNKKCSPLFELGSGPYNTIRWNPKGRFLCVAGFGNLPGDMAFWDYSKKEQLGITKAEWSVTSEWSPDGNYFLTATTAPRLQVDNGIKIFHYNGSLYFKKMFEKLYQAEWRPESADGFAEIVELATSVGAMSVGAKKSNIGQSQKSTTTAVSAQKPAPYRPPHSIRAAAAQEELFGGSSAEQMSKNALRNKKKREKQKEKQKDKMFASAGDIPPV